jgi:hypothetical protein
MVVTAIIGGVIIALAVAEILAEVILKFQQIFDWFMERRTRVRGGLLSEADLDRAGFTLQDIMATGKYRTVQGVFNTATKEVEHGARAIISNHIDDELADYHRGNRLVMYT